MILVFVHMKARLRTSECARIRKVDHVHGLLEAEAAVILRLQSVLEDLPSEIEADHDLDPKWIDAVNQTQAPAFFWINLTSKIQFKRTFKIMNPIFLGVLLLFSVGLFLIFTIKLSIVAFYSGPGRACDSF